MRSKRLQRNVICSLLAQISTVICAFILPRLILLYYGSATNGLVNSITQFLQLFAFLDMGVGTVVLASLYKPLAYKDWATVSKVVKSAKKFFRRLSYILAVYILILTIGYSIYASYSFDYLYTSILILSMGVSSFSQYLFGIVDQLLLIADQRGYIQNLLQIGTLVVNTFVCSLMIRKGCSIQLVKLVTSCIFLMKPIIQRYYIHKNYIISADISYDSEPIKQKWNGVAQHIAAVVLDCTDTIVLSLFSTFENVSIYSVFYLVVGGIKKLLISMVAGVQSLIGELWAKQEYKELNSVFGWFEWLVHTITVFIFGCMGILLQSFVSIYTNGVSDANYYQPLFSALIVMGNAGHCLRIPYNTMILAAGHFKETQHCYLIAAGINLILSIIFVFEFGLIGVAIGTVIAMLYQTIWMAVYISKNINHWPLSSFIKQFLIDLGTAILCVLLTIKIPFKINNYFDWVIAAFKVATIWGGCIIIINYYTNRNYLQQIVLFMKRKFFS